MNINCNDCNMECPLDKICSCNNCSMDMCSNCSVTCTFCCKSYCLHCIDDYDNWDERLITIIVESRKSGNLLTKTVKYLCRVCKHNKK